MKKKKKETHQPMIRTVEDMLLDEKEYKDLQEEVNKTATKEMTKEEIKALFAYSCYD